MLQMLRGASPAVALGTGTLKNLNRDRPAAAGVLFAHSMDSSLRYDWRIMLAQTRTNQSLF